MTTPDTPDTTANDLVPTSSPTSSRHPAGQTRDDLVPLSPSPTEGDEVSEPPRPRPTSPSRPGPGGSSDLLNSGSVAGPLGSVAVGRLSDAERGAIGWAVERDWQLRDQRDDWDGLHAAVERVVREHTDRALAAAWDEGWRAGRGRGPGHTDACPIGGGRHDNPYRAARQERGR